MKPERILQIKGSDWLKGISIHPHLMKGGVFKTAQFDPFRRLGVATTFNAGVRYGNATVTKIPKYFAGFNDGGTLSFYIWADNGTSPALYKTSFGGTVTDVSANVTVTNSLARGLIVWKNKLVYARDTEIRCINLTGTPSDTQLLSGLTSGDHPLTIGADLNLYCPNGNSIARLTSTAGTSGNTTSCFDFETGMNIRHLVNDGRYLVVMGDDNSLGSTTNSNFRTLVAFWDLTSPNLAQRYDFISSGIIGGGQLDDGTYVIGRDALYVTNVATFPKVICPFIGNSNISVKPYGVGAIVVRGNQLIWGNASFMGYGNLVSGDKKIFHVPMTTSAASGNISAIGVQGTTLWAGTDASELYAYDNSGTAISCTVALSNITFEKPYKFEYAKVVTQSALSSGQNCSFSISTANNAYQITQPDDITFSADGARNVLIFRTKNTAGNAFAQTFEDLTNIVITINAPVIKFEIWATPVDNQDSKVLT